MRTLVCECMCVRGRGGVLLQPGWECVCVCVGEGVGGRRVRESVWELVEIHEVRV